MLGGAKIYGCFSGGKDSTALKIVMRLAAEKDNTVSLIFGISMLDILSLCKAEEVSNVYPLLTDNNTADDNIGSVIMLFINDTVH